ncbi:hypothetical protein [Enterobacter kobei]|uniref:hypothetical protein n=1 Tax=Enterobacter kobei TaxID=208224 RepID=UPI000667DB96|nr:hypothetical protein [Enterobacter kobei]
MTDDSVLDGVFDSVKKEAERFMSCFSGSHDDVSSYNELRDRCESKAKEKINKFKEEGGHIMDDNFECMLYDANFSAQWNGKFGTYLAIAFFFYHWGQYCYSSGLRREGLLFMARAAGCGGVWQGAGLYADRVETAELALKKKQDHGKKGGEVTGSALAPARDELKRLLETNCPSEGWKTKTAAIDSVVGQLTDFVETHKIKLKTDNLYNAILTWCKRYPALKDVLESSLHKNRKK